MRKNKNILSYLLVSGAILAGVSIFTPTIPSHANNINNMSTISSSKKQNTANTTSNNVNNKVNQSSQNPKPLLSNNVAVKNSKLVNTPNNSTVYRSKKAAYDISQYQGYISQRKADALRHEVKFMILRTQGGTGYPDAYINHNEDVLNNAGVHYGVYSYSYYGDSENVAKAEARTLYQRSPYADFYVNDLEWPTSGTSYYYQNRATKAWASEMKKLTDKPVVLYSGEYYMNYHISQATRNKYNAIWLAAYGVEPAPSYHYDLWQYADNDYSPALKERVDADDFPQGNDKPLAFWTGENIRGKHRNSISPASHISHRKKIIVHPSKSASSSKRSGFSRTHIAINAIRKSVNYIKVNRSYSKSNLRKMKNIIADYQQQINIIKATSRKLPHYLSHRLNDARDILNNNKKKIDKYLSDKTSKIRKRAKHPLKESSTGYHFYRSNVHELKVKSYRLHAFNAYYLGTYYNMHKGARIRDVRIIYRLNKENKLHPFAEGKWHGIWVICSCYSKYVKKI